MKKHGSVLRYFDPVSGHVPWGGVRVLYEKDAQRARAACADRLRGRRNGRGFGLESADPGHRGIERDGEVVVRSGSGGLLDRNSVPAGARPHHSASARQKRPDGRPEKPSPTDDHDGAGRDAAPAARRSRRRARWRFHSGSPFRTSPRARSFPCRSVRRE